MKQVLYVDMDNVLVDFQSAFEHLDETTLQEYEGRMDEVTGIFSLMKPMPVQTLVVIGFLRFIHYIHLLRFYPPTKTVETESTFS